MAFFKVNFCATFSLAILLFNPSNLEEVVWRSFRLLTPDEETVLTM